jgi:hypothetical protein
MRRALLSRSGRPERVLSGAAIVAAAVLASAPAVANGIFHNPTTSGEKGVNDGGKAVHVTGKAIEETKTIQIQWNGVTPLPGQPGTGSGGPPKPGTGPRYGSPYWGYPGNA